MQHQSWQFVGTVTKGVGRGKALGFPTANLVPDSEAPLPEPGVYVGRVWWNKGPAHGALVNYGVRPTFEEDELSLEVHILDFAGELYGTRLHIEISSRLRDEQKFESGEALARQISVDIQQARSILADGVPTP